MNPKIILSLIIFLGLFGLIKKSKAATRNVTCSGDIMTALTSATSAANNGDIVNIGAGLCSVSPAWVDRIGWTDKNITLQGAGRTFCKMNKYFLWYN